MEPASAHLVVVLIGAGYHNRTTHEFSNRTIYHPCTIAQRLLEAEP